MSLDDYTTDDLKKEIEKRKEEVKIKPVPLNMALNDRSDFAETKKACMEYIQEIANGKSDIDKEFVFESAMEAVYGKDVWDWVNKNFK